MSTMRLCDWCGVITDCEQRDINEWVCSDCWAENLEKVRVLYDPDDGPVEDDDVVQDHTP